MKMKYGFAWEVEFTQDNKTFMTDRIVTDNDSFSQALVACQLKWDTERVSYTLWSLKKIGSVTVCINE